MWTVSADPRAPMHRTLRVYTDDLGCAGTTGWVPIKKLPRRRQH